MTERTDEFAIASCMGKARFASHAAASRIQRRRGRKRDNGLRAGQVYRCQVCRNWHIGRRSDQDRPKHEFQRFKARYERGEA